MSRITEWEREAKRIGSSAKVFAILEAAEDVADVSHRATPVSQAIARAVGCGERPAEHASGDRTMSKRKTPQAPYGLIIGIDPGQLSNGLCVLDARADSREYQSLGFIEEAIRSELLSRMAWLAQQDGLRVFAMIECPTWSGPGTREVRSAAMVWERELKRLFPSRTVKRVCPNKWQPQILGVSGKTPSAARKIASLVYARSVIQDHKLQCDHVADAICICEYGRLMAAGLVST